MTQALNTKQVANNWPDKKAIDVFELLLGEEKCAWKWWNYEMPMTYPTLDRTDWLEVWKEFKKRWPLLPEIGDDKELKWEELEAMKLKPQNLGTKIRYRGQELYSHMAFTIEAAWLANEVGDTAGFLLPALWNKLPEALWNILKSQGNRPRTWDDFRKAMVVVLPTDLWEEVAEISH